MNPELTDGKEDQLNFEFFIKNSERDFVFHFSSGLNGNLIQDFLDCQIENEIYSFVNLHDNFQGKRKSKTC